MKRARAKSPRITVKLVLIAPPAVDLHAVMTGFASAWQGSVVREYELASLRALRWQFPYRRNALEQEKLVSVHAISGSTHHLAVLGTLLGNADGILFLLPLDPAQHQACVQCLRETSQLVKELGADLREMPLALLYTQLHLALASGIDDWDRLLECEKYRLPRFCVSSATHEGAQLAVHAVMDRIPAAPRLRLV